MSNHCNPLQDQWLKFKQAMNLPERREPQPKTVKAAERVITVQAKKGRRSAYDKRK